ncbi:MAG TPA: LpqB family beta-propeller domain-containing protein [Vicinamibacteria bacterium]|nr:LpqB family beta-propeller domain-containing protein [Vicinamibacteria bacterium]
MTTMFLTAMALAGLLEVESLLSIRHPGSPAWSPDGSHVAFVWDRAGVQNLFVVDAVGGWPQARTAYRDGVVGAPFWSADGSVVYFERDGELYEVPRAGAVLPQAVFGTEARESDVRLSPDGRQVAFVRLGDVWIRNLESGREKRLTVTLVSESDLRWSPDGARIAFLYTRSAPRTEGYDYIGRKLLFQRVEGDPQDVGVVSIEGGGVVPVGASPQVEHFPRWLDARRLTLERVSTDLRVREILLADATTGELRTLHRDEDVKWWSLGYLGAEPRPAPDGRFVAFVSDATGWDRLYVVSANGGEARPLTSDGEEVRRFAWSPDGRSIAFDSNADAMNPGRRHLFVVDVEGADGPRRLTSGTGTNTQPADASGFGLVNELGGWSPDGSKLLFQHTDSRRPADLFWLKIGDGAPPRELTYSLPPSVDRNELIEPELVFYAAPDGRQVPAYLFVPRDLDRERKHPAIVWIHGDGIAQNYEGWHIRRDYAVYYSFHQYLAQQGYIVLAPDYRGSIGYGKEWRQLPFRDLGGGDYEDIAASVPYLESLLYVDPERIGVWGLSYGGFLTLKALTEDPELFRCGIDVAGVHDFRYWHRDPGGRWIVGRLGDPDENPEAYLQAAPVERVDRIVRPLLVLHGTADVNVPFLESLHLIDELMKKGKNVDFVAYPGEFHYFHREHVLRDAWRRVEEFFSAHLRG